MTLDAFILLVVLVSATVGFIQDRYPPEGIAFAALIVLTLSGILSVKEALGGFSNEATVTVACMFVLSAGLMRSGALGWVGRALVRFGTTPLRLTFMTSMTAGPANFIKHLAVNKQYLYELILKRLTQFGQKNLEGIVFEKIAATNVLIEKGLVRAAHHELKKGQAIATEYELFELQIMLASLEKKLLALQQSEKKDDTLIEQIFNKEMNSLEQLKNTIEYGYLAQQVLRFQMQFQKIQNEEQQKYMDSLTHSPTVSSTPFSDQF